LPASANAPMSGGALRDTPSMYSRGALTSVPFAAAG